MKNRLLKFRKLITSFLLVALLVFGFFVFFDKDIQTAEAGWWDDSWSFRRVFSLTNSNTAILTDFQTLLEINTTELIANSKMNADCSDMRFALDNGTELNYVIEENSPGCNATSTKVWVKVPSISIGQNQADVYMYYGNVSAVDAQDGTAVMEFYDNFEILDPAIWTGSGAHSTSSGELSIATGAVTTNATVSAMPGVIVEARMRWDNFQGAYYSGLNISDSFPTLGSNAGKNKVIYYFTNASAGQTNIVGSASDGVAANYNILSGYTVFYAATSTYYTLGSLIYDDQLKLYKDRSSVITRDGSWTDSFQIALGYFTGNGVNDIKDMTVDWVQVRKYAETMPSYTYPETEDERPGDPVGYWSFDEGYGTTAHDESGQGNDGAISGATWKSEEECISGKCLYFDGVTNVVDLGIIEALNDKQDNVTFSAWIKKETINERDTIISAARENSAFNGFSLAIEYDNVRFTTLGLLDTDSETAIIEANKWYFITAVSDSASDVTFYLNGLPKDSFSGEAGFINNDDKYLIGAITASSSSNLTNLFNGYIDEVKIYPYARTADQIKQDYNAGLAGVKSSKGVAASFGSKSDKWMSDGLVGYWKMDESATTTGAIDSSGNGNDGTYEGTASTTGGKFGRGGVFDGDDDYINGQSALSLTNNSFTINAFFKSEHVLSSTDKFLIWNGEPASSGEFVNIYIDKWTGAVVAKTQIGYEGSTVESIDTFTDGSDWHMLSYVRNGTSDYRLYIDGDLVDVDNTELDFIPETTDLSFTIGGDDGAVANFEGKIDEVRIYNRALSDAEVRRLYEWAPGPIMHLKMDEMSGTSTYDISGSGNDGVFATTASSQIWARGKYGTALDFDGDDDYLSVPEIHFSSSDTWTINSWLFDESFNTDTNWFGRLASNSYLQLMMNGNPDLAYREHDGNVRIFTVDGGYSQYKNKWTHHSYVAEGSVVKLYLNGIYKDEVSVNSREFHIQAIGKAYYTSGREYGGRIDDVRIYNYARTQKQILEDMHNGDAMRGAVLDLNFDEGLGATAYDSSIHKNNGSLQPGVGGTNTASSAMWSLDGHSGGAMEFDGVDDYVVIPNVEDWLDLTLGSISFWYQANNAADGDYLVYYSNGSGETISITTTAGINIRCFVTGNWITGYIDISVPNVATDTAWHHIVFTWDKNDINKTLTATFDGETASNNATLGEPNSYTGSFSIGARTDGSLAFPSSIDQVKIYPYALTEEEIKKEYSSGVSTQLGSTGTESDGVTKTNSKSREYCVPGDTATCDPPVLELDFDEKTGGTVYDKSGNGNDGTISGASWESVGKIGSALSFDGVDDYVDIVDDDNLDGYTNFTTSFWAKRENSSGFPSFVDKYVTTGSQRAFKIYTSSDDEIATWISDNGTNNANILTNNNCGFLDNEWTYFSIVFNLTDTEVIFYRNGFLCSTGSSGSVSSIYNSNANLNIGYSQSTADSFDGIIDDVRIYNYARTPAQIAYDYNYGKPIAHWKFDECSGSTIHDNSGNGNDGTLELGFAGVNAIGTCASSSDSFWYNGRSGKVNSSGSFDGESDYVDMGVSFDDVQSGTDFTFGAWVKPVEMVTGAAADYQYILSQKVSYNSDYGFMFGLATNGRLYLDIGGGAGYYEDYSDDNVYTSGEYQYVTVTYKSGQGAGGIKFYVNGVSAGSNASEAHSKATTNFYIGRIGAGNYFNGEIDELKIWNYPLTDEQVKSEYSGGAVRFGE